MKLQANIGSKLWFNDDLQIEEVPIVDPMPLARRQPHTHIPVPATESYKKGWSQVAGRSLVVSTDYYYETSTDDKKNVRYVLCDAYPSAHLHDDDKESSTHQLTV